MELWPVDIHLRSTWSQACAEHVDGTEFRRASDLCWGLSRGPPEGGITQRLTWTT